MFKVELKKDDGAWGNTKLTAKTLEGFCRYLSTWYNEHPDRDGYYYEDIEIVPADGEVRLIANLMHESNPHSEEAVLDFTYRLVPIEVV